MIRQPLGLVAVVSLIAACGSSHHPVSKPDTGTAAVETAVLRAYATTIGGVSSRVDSVSRDLRRCVSPIAQCQHDAAAARTLAVYLIRTLTIDDGKRETDGTAPLPPGISPAVISTENEARAVDRTSHSISTHSGKLVFTQLATQVKRLAADVDAWEPGGRAAKALAAVHVLVPKAAAS
jgi:outer membrane murein-binding lipoprotein Lpp